MKILALDFSSPQRSVAVMNPGAGAVAEVLDTSHRHTMKPFAMIESALQQAGLEREQIEGIAVGLGPGSYTGIRAAIALAQGWQLARGVKLIGVSSAECVVAQAQADGLTGRCSVVIDAQRGEYYLAEYEITNDGVQEVAALRLASFDSVQEREQAGDILIGPEVQGRFPRGRIVFPRAGTMAQLELVQRNNISGASLSPIYLREANFVKSPPRRIIPPAPGQVPTP